MVRCIAFISYLAYPPNKVQGFALASFLSSSKLEKERKENAGVRERFILANAPDAANNYRVRRVRCSIAEAERLVARQESMFCLMFFS